MIESGIRKTTTGGRGEAPSGGAEPSGCAASRQRVAAFFYYGFGYDYGFGYGFG